MSKFYVWERDHLSISYVNQQGNRGCHSNVNKTIQIFVGNTYFKDTTNYFKYHTLCIKIDNFMTQYASHFVMKIYGSISKSSGITYF